MIALNGTTELVKLLDQAATTLARIALPDEHARVRELSARVEHPRLRILVAGEAKRGKSTLINRLVGRDLLPTGVVPVTAVSTTVRAAGTREQAEVRYLDGRTATTALDQLSGFVSETGNRENHLRIDSVVVSIPVVDLPIDNVEFVDTPGTGSVLTRTTQTARRAHDTVDCAVMVLSATPPIGDEERQLLIALADRAVSVFVVLNKADQLDDGELAESLAFTERVCGEAGINGSVWPISARLGDRGYHVFRDELISYVHSRGAQDAARALIGHTIRLARQMLDRSRTSQRADEMRREGRTAQLEAFGAEIQRLRDQGLETADTCQSFGRRQRRLLTESADVGARVLLDRCHGRVHDPTADRLRPLEADDVAQLRADCVAQIAETVLDWRQDRASALLGGLHDLADRCASRQELARTLLRQAGRDLLGLSLALEREPVRLASSRSFWLDFSPSARWDPPLASLARQHFPGAGRRALRQLVDELPRLVDRQFGRARADLQARLDETLRRLVAELARADDDTAGLLEQALEPLVDRAAIEDRGEQQARRAESERIQTLEDLIGQLTATESPEADYEHR